MARSELVRAELASPARRGHSGSWLSTLKVDRPQVRRRYYVSEFISMYNRDIKTATMDAPRYGPLRHTTMSLGASLNPDSCAHASCATPSPVPFLRSLLPARMTPISESG